VTEPDQPDQPDHWFEPVADHLGTAYLRYSFTKGTEQEVGFLGEALGLRPGQRLLDVGCGPGRHAHAFARRGIEVVGVDISQRFVDIAATRAPPGASFVRADARRLNFDAEFDAAISLCQGAFGLAGGPDAPLDGDGEILRGLARALRPGGLAAVSAFSAYFQVRWLEGTDTFDAESGVNHERREVRDDAGVATPADLWTTCFTPRELRLLATAAGLDARAAIWSVAPGAYAAVAPTIDTPELLLVAEAPTRRPGGRSYGGIRAATLAGRAVRRALVAVPPPAGARFLFRTPEESRPVRVRRPVF
jgi:SAM-dependent methyltransferase